MGKKRPGPASNGQPNKKQRRETHDGATGSNTFPVKKGRKSEAKADLKAIIFPPRPDWHASELIEFPTTEKATTADPGSVTALHEYGRLLLEQDNARYSELHLKSSSSHKFLSTIMASGTMEDKVSALTLVVQESPLHTMKAFENLVNFCGKKSRQQALMALSALKDLLGQGVVLPPDRKLKAFAKQPGLLGALRNSKTKWRTGQPLPEGIQQIHLVVWAYEDWLKQSYFQLLQNLERWCNDEIDYARSRAVTYVWELLKEKPEQEENLLRLLINKLGDKERKIASKVSYLLLQLQVTHPVMKSVIIAAIESECLFRPGQNSHAIYYAVVTLNQTILGMREQDVANKLLEVYFGLFLNLLKATSREPASDAKSNDHVQGGGGKPGRKARQKAKELEKSQHAEIELGDKIIAQVLTGVNRAYPFAETEGADFDKHVDTLFRITHSANFNTSVQAMMLIQQISASKHHSADRFYRMLYESLLDPRLPSSSKQIMYLNLLYRALQADISIKRVKAFVKRLLQIVTLHEPPFACAVLYLVFDLEGTFPSIKGMLSHPEEPAEDEGASVVADEAGNAGRHDEAQKNSAVYDSRKRDPEHSNAERSCLWELIPFLTHFHPSVSLFASSLLLQGKMPAKPDPSLYTSMHFLDRFVYRNAKTKADVQRGSSIMQPLATSAAADLLIKSRDGGSREMPLNNEAFWLKKSQEIAPDEVFFHKYFQQEVKKKTRQERKAEKKRKAGEDGDEESADEDEIWKALVDSRPEIEGEDDDEEGFSDMEDYEDDEIDLEAGDDAEMLEEGEDQEDQEEDDEIESGDDFTADLEDEDALVGSDEEVQIDVPEEDDGKPESKSQKKRKERKKLKQLPVFASFEDYAKLLEDDADE